MSVAVRRVSKINISSLNVMVFVAMASLACAFLISFMGPQGLILILCSILAFIAYVNIKVALNLFMVLIILLPKINIIGIPGTYIAVRSEDFLLLFLAIVAVFYAFIKGKLFDVPRLALPIGFFVLATLVSLVAGIFQNSTPNQLLGILFFFRRIEYFIPFLLAYWVLDDNDESEIDRIFIITFCITAVVSMLQYFNIIGGFYSGQYVPITFGRVFSTFSGPYEYAFYLAIVFSYYAARYFQKAFGAVTFDIFMIVSSFYIMMLTAARITIASIPASILILTGLLRRFRFMAVILMILITMVVLLPSNVKGRFQSLMGENTLTVLNNLPDDTSSFLVDKDSGETIALEGVDMTFLSRYLTWRHVWRGFSQYPLFGAGPSAFGEAVELNYLRVLGENGIFGLIAFLWVLMALFRSSYRNMMKGLNEKARQYSTFIFCVLIMFMINSLFTDVFEASKAAILFWFLVGLYYRVISIKAPLKGRA